MDTSDKTIERAQRMLADLKAAKIPRHRIARESGVNEVTLWQIGKGSQSKVSERVFDAIWDFWSEHERWRMCDNRFRRQYHPNN